MYLIIIAWFYVTAMMAVAEAASPQGSLLGAAITFVLYGALPMGILAYILGTPQRKRRLKAQRAAEQKAWDAAQTRQSSANASSPSTALPQPLRSNGTTTCSTEVASLQRTRQRAVPHHKNHS